MSQPLLPSLEPHTLRLARDNGRTGRAVEQLPTLVKELLAAWNRCDQRALRELSFRLVNAAMDHASLSAAAAEFEKNLRARNRHAAHRELLALLGEVGSLRRRGILPVLHPQVRFA